MKYLSIALLLLSGCVTIRYSQKPLDNFMVGCVRGQLAWQFYTDGRVEKRTEMPTDKEIREADDFCESIKPKFKEPTVNE